MRQTVLRVLLRLFYAAMICLDGAVWFCAVEFYIAGWWLGSPPLRQVSLMLLMLMTLIHFTLDLWPMQWANRLFNRVIDHSFPLPDLVVTEQDVLALEHRRARRTKIKAFCGFHPKEEQS